jgi:hypothetical protein
VVPPLARRLIEAIDEFNVETTGIRDFDAQLLLRKRL